MMMMTMMIVAMVLDGGRSTTNFADCVRLRPIVFLLLLLLLTMMMMMITMTILVYFFGR